MHIDEILLLKILVNGIGNQGADTEHGLKGVGPGTQMGDGAQIFKGMTLFLKRVIRSGGSFHGYT